MSRPRTVSIDEVISSAKLLLQNGKSINGTSLRSVIGRGRPNTLMAIYQEYVDQNGQLPMPLPEVAGPEDDNSNPELPTEIAEQLSVVTADVVHAIQVAVQQCNTIANNIHNKRVNREVLEARAKREEAALQVEEINQQLTDAYNDNEDKRELIDTLNEAEEELQRQVATLSEQLKSSKSMYDAEVKKNSDQANTIKELNKNNATLNRDIASKDSVIEQLKASNNSLEATNTELKQSLESKSDELNEAHSSNAVLESQIDNAKQQLESEKASHDEWRTELNKQLDNEKSLSNQANAALVESENKLKQLRTERDELESNANDAAHESSRLNSEVTRLSGDLERLNKEKVDIKAQLDEMANQLKTERDNNSQLQHQLISLAQERSEK